MRAKTSLRRAAALLLCLVMLMQNIVLASADTFDPTSATPQPSPASDFTVSAAGAITGYSGSDDNIVIPKEINGITVKSMLWATAWASPPSPCPRALRRWARACSPSAGSSCTRWSSPMRLP